eukprot:SAG11_NODE_12_length_27025_cov_37.402681_22_plen_301_part_00
MVTAGLGPPRKAWLQGFKEGGPSDQVGSFLSKTVTIEGGTGKDREEDEDDDDAATKELKQTVMRLVETLPARHFGDVLSIAGVAPAQMEKAASGETVTLDIDELDGKSLHKLHEFVSDPARHSSQKRRRRKRGSGPATVEPGLTSGPAPSSRESNREVRTPVVAAVAAGSGEEGPASLMAMAAAEVDGEQLHSARSVESSRHSTSSHHSGAMSSRRSVASSRRSASSRHSATSSSRHSATSGSSRRSSVATQISGSYTGGEYSEEEGADSNSESSEAPHSDTEYSVTPTASPQTSDDEGR